jgi:hypothetical protein
MRIFLCLGLAGFTLLFAGCSWFHRSHAAATSAPPAAKVAPVIITPAQSAAANVVLVHESARFVILNFPDGRLPAEGQMLDLFRNGLKTAEVRISKFRQENNVTADIISGEARKGDQAREQ